MALAATLPPVTSFDIPIVGLTATPDPVEASIPKNTDSAVRLVVRAADRTLTTSEVTSFLGPDFQVRADLSGPGLDRPLALPAAGASLSDPLLLPVPALSMGGDYRLSNIRLARNGVTLLDATPSQIPVKVIDQILVTSVKTRPLTMDEIREKGIVLDSDDYTGFEFTLGMASESQSVSFSMPVVFDRQGVPVPQVITPPPAPGRTGVVSTGGAPEPLIIPTLLEVDLPLAEIPEFERQMQTPSGERIRIPSVVVIPGNVGYLKQFFSAQLFVANGAPVGSGLSVRQVTGTVKLPPGADAQVGTADDPLALPETTRGVQPTTMVVRGVGPDGTPATADDVDVLVPAAQGQAEFLIRGEKEGYHELTFDVAATLDGLPIGPVTVKGQAKGGVLVRNPFFNMSFTIPSVVRKGETFSIFATLSNIGQSLANDVHVTLDGSRMAGATLVGEPTQIVDTLRPKDAATLEFKFISQRSGQVYATYLGFDTASAGGLVKFTMGVGERGIALSPDTLVLPTSVDGLPATVVAAAMRVLGQAWSIGNAPTGTLPPEVIRISRTVTTQKALALAEAGLRVSLGQDPRAAVRDLAFDYYGGSPLDAGFDQLLRTTDAGHDLANAIGAALADAMVSAGGALVYGALVDNVAVSGPDFLGIVVGQGAGAAPVAVTLTDDREQATAAPISDTVVPRSEIPGAVWLPLGAGLSGPLLGLVTELSSRSYTLDLVANGGGSVELAVTQPRGDGSFTRGYVAGVPVTTGARLRVVIDRWSPETVIVSVDADGDGSFETTQTMASTRVSAPGASLLAAAVVGPETIDGASPFGFQVAAVFDRVVDATTAGEVSHYAIPSNSLQNARRQLSGRIVFASLNLPEGPYVPTTLSASGIRDSRGAAGPASTVTLTSRLEDPGAVVSGRVIGADGTPLTTGTVTYENSSNWQCRDIDGSSLVGFAATNLDAQGRYELRYVRQDSCGQPWAMVTKDPRTGAVRRVSGFVRTAGEQIVLDIALIGEGTVSGVVRDLAGTPVGGAAVTVVSVTDPQVGGRATTDGDGRYIVYGISVGQVNVTAAKGSGVGHASGSIGRSGGTAEVDVSIDSGAASVAGTLWSVEGQVTKAVPGISVVFEADGIAVAVVATDAAGAYRFASVPAGAFKISAALNTRDQASVSGVVAAGENRAGVDLVISIPVAGQPPPSGDLGWGTVKGLVRLPGGAAAPNTVVSIEDRGVLTGADGGFEISGVRAQPNVNRSVLARSRDGLRSGSANIMMNQAGQVVANVAIVLSGLGSAEITVLGPTGTPLAGLDVGTTDRCDGACGCAPKTSDINGKVRFDNLPLGSLHVKAVRQTVSIIDVASTTVSITSDGELATGTLRFAGAGNVSGLVRDGNGQPVFGADVTLQSRLFDPSTCSLGSAVSQRMRTNSAGQYQFQGVNLGAVAVSASQVFFPTPVGTSANLTVNGQNLVLPDLVLKANADTRAGELSGIVYMPDGKTPAGAGIELTATGALPDVVVSTDAQGHYRFAKIFPEGVYTLTVRDPVTGGVARASVSLRAGEDLVFNIRLLGRGTVIVKVVDAANKEVKTAFVRLTETGFPGRTFEGAVDEAHLGIVIFENVDEGSLAAEASDVYARGGRASGVLVGDKATLEMKVRLSMTGKVTGIFVAADGTTPIPFGSVTLTSNGSALGTTTTQGSGSEVGRFSFDYVPAGSVYVSAQDPMTARSGVAVGTISSQDQVLDLRVRAQGVGIVEGLVTSNSAPQPGAEVSLRAGGFNASTVADSDGRYRFTGVPEGQVSVTASLGNGYLSGTASGTLRGDGTTLALDVALRGSGKVTGKVVKSDGVTAPKPTRVSIQVGGTGGGSFSTVTATDGSFVFERIPAGAATLTAAVLGSIDSGAASTNVPAADTVDVTIRLHGVGSLRGVAQDSIGQVTRGTLVLTGTGDIRYSMTVALGADGAFAFPELLAGPFTVSLTIQTGSFPLYGSATGTIEPDQEAFVRVRVQATGTVTGRVLRSDGITPALGTRVTLALEPNRGSLVLYAQEDGRFAIPGVPLGAFSLRFLDTLSGGAALVQGRSVDENGATVDVGDVLLDESQVSVVSFSPSFDAVQVPVNQPVIVTFSHRLQSASGVQIDDGTRSLSPTASLSADGLVVTLQGTWTDSASINVVVTTAVTDIYGRHPLKPTTSRFHTVDLTPPRVVAILPQDKAIEVAVDPTVTVTFNELLDPSTNFADLVKLSSGSTSIPGLVTRTSDYAVAFAPYVSLVTDAVFTVTVNGARDGAGNVQTQAFVSTFKTHDTLAPLLSLTQPAPGTWTNLKRPTIVVTLSDSQSGADSATATLTLDGKTTHPTISGTSLSYAPGWDLTDGAHPIVASVVDWAGNPGSLAAEVWVDTTPPAAAELGGIADGQVLLGAVLVAAASSDAGSGVREIRVYSDGALVLTLQEPDFVGTLTTSALSDGQHRLTARAMDRAGNLGPEGAGINVIVNNRAITVTITEPAVGKQVRDFVTVKATASEPIKRMVFAIGDVSITDDTSPYEAALPVASVAEGPATVTVTAVGLLDETGVATRGIVVDRTPPVAPDVTHIFAEPPDNGLSLVHGTVGAVENLAVVSAMNLATAMPASTPAGGDGSFATRLSAAVGDTVELVATDAAGNVSASVTVVVLAMTTLPPGPGSLSYVGTIVDRVGPGLSAIAPDGKSDAVFEFGFTMGAGITRQLSLIDLQGPSGARSTRLEAASTLGVSPAGDLGAVLLNQPDGTISASLSETVTVLLFAADDGWVVPGGVYTATAVFTNGSTYVASVTMPAAPQREATSAVFGVGNGAPPTDPGLPTVTTEVVSAAFSVSNQELPPELPTPGATEVLSAPFSVNNQELPPELPTGGATEVLSTPFSVSNEELPPELPTGGATEISSVPFSVNNLELPPELPTPGPTEVESVPFSMDNEELPPSPEGASVTEVMSGAFSLNNDPSYVPPDAGGEARDAGVPAAQDANGAADAPM